MRVSRSQTLKVISAALTIAAVVFLAKSLAATASDFRIQDLSFGWKSGCTIVLFVGAVLLSGVLWSHLLESITHKPVETSEAMWAHVQSWLLKYVPGQVGSAAGKLVWGERHSISRRHILVSFLYENLLHLVASFSISLPVVFAAVPETRSTYVGFIAAVFAAQLALLATPIVADWGPARRVHRLSYLRDNLVLPAPTTLRFEAFYLVPRIINGVGFAFLAWELDLVDSTTDGIVFGSAYVLAGIIGILAFLVPSGLGVREAVIVLVLGPTIGDSDALLLAGTARIYTVVADLILFAGYLVSRRTRHQETRTHLET